MKLPSEMDRIGKSDAVSKSITAVGHATYLLSGGAELRTVMDLLGHSTIRLTADTYGHVLRSRAQDAAEQIDRIMNEDDENPPRDH